MSVNEGKHRNLLNEIDQFISGEVNLSRTELIGYLLHRVSYNENKKAAEIGMSIYEQKYTSHESIPIQSFSIDEAIALMHDLTLSKAQLRKWKGYLSAKGIFFPYTNHIAEAR